MAVAVYSQSVRSDTRPHVRSEADPTTCYPLGVLAALTLVSTLVAGSAGDVDNQRYRVDVSGTTQALRVGEEGTLAVRIQPAEGFKVNEKGPLELRLSAPNHLDLDKDAFGRADATGQQVSPTFATEFRARGRGDEPIAVNAKFVLCDTAGTVCEIKRERVTVAVRVSP